MDRNEQYRQQAAERFTQRNDLDAQTAEAQSVCLGHTRTGRSRTPEALEAMRHRDALEAQLIALDSKMQSLGEVEVERLPLYTRLLRDEQEWKRQLHLAHSVGDAAGVNFALAELRRIWEVKDQRKGL